MIWSKCKLYKNIKGSADALGNPTYGEPELVAVIPCRFSAFDNVKQNLDRGPATENVQYFTLADAKDDIPAFDYVTVEDNKFRVEELINSGPRWTIIRCKIYGL